MTVPFAGLDTIHATGILTFLGVCAIRDADLSRESALRR